MDQLPNIKFLQYSTTEYFKNLINGIKRSSRFELFDFLGVRIDEIGTNGVLGARVATRPYEGSILPESYSNYDKGYKIVSFYIDPQALLERSYVLRKDGWRDVSGLYQRLIANSKINSIRKYLIEHKRVFINNIIVTLPDTTKILNQLGNTVDPDKLKKTEPVTIQIPEGMNSIGLIDGQHRVYSYHEGGYKDEIVEKLRIRQNLLVTGIIYPENVTDIEKTRFESRLFLEINNNQANAKTDLKQAIGLMIQPFAVESMATFVLQKLNDKGYLQDKFERHSYDRGKVKTTSIVSFGLKPLIKVKGDDCLFYVWTHVNKNDIKNEDPLILDQYTEFCHEEIDRWLGAVKSNLDNLRWTTSHSNQDRVLTTTILNGLLICFRNVIKNKGLMTQQQYEEKLTGLNSFNFKQYKSSQYSRMGLALYSKFFK
jgi:DGQHR domain-containing protein